MKRNTYVINLWGLGDLIPTLECLARYNLRIKLITLQDEKIVNEILKLLEIEKKIEVISMGKFVSAIYIFYKTLNGASLIFSAPLSGKARRYASFLKKFSNKILLAEEKGNIYLLNSEIFKGVRV